MLVAAADHAFACAMYTVLRTIEGNLLFSPFSLRRVLAMLYAGAGGETAAELRAVLRLPADAEALHRELAGTVGRLTAVGGNAHEMALANSLWVQQGSAILPGFLDLLTRHYESGVTAVDFAREAESARQAINRWVEDRTRQRIGELVPPGAVTGRTRLVLANAVYFKGQWVEAFDRHETRRQEWHLAGGGTVPVRLMYRRGRCPYVEAAGFQAVDLAYRDSDVSMLVLLPERPDGMRNLEAAVSPELLDECVAGQRVTDIELFLPRFEITWGVADVCRQLMEMGIRDLFDDVHADLSGINGARPPSPEALFVSAVFHKAFVSVDEEGTEAAAATAVGIPLSAPGGTPRRPVPVFRADHPFLFALRDRRSGAILFLGRLSEPAGTGVLRADQPSAATRVLDIQVIPSRRRSTLALRGPLTREGVERLRSIVEEQLDGGVEGLVLDCDAVTDVDSAGLGELARTHAAGLRRSATVTIAHPSPRLRNLLRVAQLLTDPQRLEKTGLDPRSRFVLLAAIVTLILAWVLVWVTRR